MKNNKKNAYKGYKRAHFYTMIGSIALGLCLIIATIIIVCFFSVEVKVENPTTTVTQIQPNNIAPEATTDANNAEPKATTDAESNTTTTEETTTPTVKETEENTDELTEVKYSTLTVRVNIYTGIYTLTYLDIVKPIGTTLSREDIKVIILNTYPSFNDIRAFGTPANYTFSDTDEVLDGEFKIKTVAEEVIEATETVNDNQEITPTETEEPTTEPETVETTETVAEATETEKDNQEVAPTETEEPAQAPTEAETEPKTEPVEEPVEEIIIDENNTSTLTITVNIYTNICKTEFVKIEKPIGTVITRQEIKDYVLSLYPSFTRVRATGTPESYTFVEEDGKFPGIIKID